MSLLDALFAQTTSTEALATTGAPVNVSLSPPPTAGQIPIATDALHAVWGDVGDLSADDTVARAAAAAAQSAADDAQDSADAAQSTADAAAANITALQAVAPSAGQKLALVGSSGTPGTANKYVTEDTFNSYVSITGKTPLWVPPASPHADNLEFDSASAPAGYVFRDLTDGVNMTISGSAPDAYTAFTTSHLVKVDYNTRRKSHASFQLSNQSHFCSYAKPTTVATDCLIIAHVAPYWRMGGAGCSFGIHFSADSSGNCNLTQNGVLVYFDTTRVWTGGKFTGGGFSSTGFQSPSSNSNDGWDYVIIHKKGTSYYCYLKKESGLLLGCGVMTHATTMGQIGYFFQAVNSGDPANDICQSDFLRRYDVSDLPF